MKHGVCLGDVKVAVDGEHGDGEGVELDDPQSHVLLDKTKEKHGQHETKKKKNRAPWRCKKSGICHGQNETKNKKIKHLGDVEVAVDGEHGDGEAVQLEGAQRHVLLHDPQCREYLPQRTVRTINSCHSGGFVTPRNNFPSADVRRRYPTPYALHPLPRTFNSARFPSIHLESFDFMIPNKSLRVRRVTCSSTTPNAASTCHSSY